MLRDGMTADQLTALQQLPMKSPMSIATSDGYIPINSSTWWTPQQLSNALQLPAATPAAAPVTTWLAANATAVYVVAAALFVLALFGGSRR